TGMRFRECVDLISERPHDPFAVPHSSVTLLSLTSLRKECGMPMQSHLIELQRRHDALDHEIARESTHPSIDEVKLAELKRRKLQIKDEIAKLSKMERETETLH